MSKEDLIPFKKGDRNAVIFGRMGGRSQSPAKGVASKWRCIKERMRRNGATEKDIEWMMEKLQNRDAMAVSILYDIQELKKIVHPSQRVALLNTEISAAKFQHGEKIKTENVNINIETSMVEWKNRLRENIEEGEE